MIGLSQLAVSHSVKELKHQTDVRLFGRTTHEIAFIGADQQLTGWLGHLLDELTVILRDAGRVGQQMSGTTKVAVNRTISTHLIPQCTVHSNRRYPDTDFVLHDRPQQRVLESICHGEVDFGIVIDPGPAADLQCEAVLAELFLLFCRENHSFTGPTGVSWRALQGERLILQDYASDSRPLIDTAPNRLVIQVNIMQEVGHPATLFPMIESRTSISVLPALMLPLSQGSHPTVEWLTPVMERQLMLTCRKDRLPSTATQALWEIMCEEGVNLTTVRVEDPPYQH